MILKSPFGFAISKVSENMVITLTTIPSNIWGKGNDVEGKKVIIDVIAELKDSAFRG
jgi:hypothetical protein